MNRCIICDVPPRRGKPLYRINALAVDGRSIRPAWCCLKHYVGTKLRQPSKKTQRLDAK